MRKKNNAIISEDKEINEDNLFRKVEWKKRTRSFYIYYIVLYIFTNIFLYIIIKYYILYSDENKNKEVSNV